MRAISSFDEMATILMERGLVTFEVLGKGLDKALVAMEKTAKSEIAHYQPEVGPFPAWAPLSPVTLEGFEGFPGKIDKGQAPPDNPLLAEGDLLNSFGHERHGLEGAMGSTDPVIVYHEFGTSKMPPRPVVGPAAFRNKDTLQMLVGAAAVAGFIGEDQVHKLLGYDFKTAPSAE